MVSATSGRVSPGRTRVRSTCGLMPGPGAAGPVVDELLLAVDDSGVVEAQVGVAVHYLAGPQRQDHGEGRHRRQVGVAGRASRRLVVVDGVRLPDRDGELAQLLPADLVADGRVGLAH